MFGLKKQFHELMKIFSRQNVRISEQDPLFLADFYRYNLPFDIASAILLCIVSFIGMAGTHAPFAAGTVLPEISATAVYMMLFGTNLLFLMLLFQEFRRFDSTAVRRTKWIILAFITRDAPKRGVLPRRTTIRAQKVASGKGNEEMDTRKRIVGQ